MAQRMGRFLGVSDLMARVDALGQQGTSLEKLVDELQHHGPDPRRDAELRSLVEGLKRQVITLEAAVRSRRAPASAADPALAGDTEVPAPVATAGEIYAGYSDEDMWVFDVFADAAPAGEPGFVTDFIGTRTRTTSLWDEVRHLDGQVMERPVPHDLFEAIEWVGLLKAVATAGDERFTMMELGAGLGPWLSAAAVAARHRGIRDLRLLGVEADPGRFELMRQQFVDNDLDPDDHRLICAAVGVEPGSARWPRIADPANASGARPVRESGGVLDQADADYMQGAVAEYIDVTIVPFADLLEREGLWDLVHVDVQGWEATLCRACIDLLTARVRWMVVGTHSRAIDGQVIEILLDAGWILENEKPTRFRFDPSIPSLDQMTEVDGVQVWRNPRFP
jgi:FkbM family methyltransferase